MKLISCHCVIISNISLFLFIIISGFELTAQSKYYDYSSNDKILVFEENFNNNDNKWIFNNKWISGKISNSQYIISDKQKTSCGISFINPNIEYSIDFEIKCHIKIKYGTGGIIWGLDNGFQHYRFDLSPDFYYYRRFYRMQTTTLDSGRYSKADSYKLNIRKVKNKVYFFLNETFLCAEKYYEPYGNKIGFNSDNSLIEINYIKIFELSTKRRNHSDHDPPQIILNQPILSKNNKYTTTESQISLKARVTDDSEILSVNLNNKQQTLDNSGNLYVNLSLNTGINYFELQAKDDYNNVGVFKFIINKESEKQKSANTDKNKIIIESPLEENMLAPQNEVNLKATIESESPITEISVYCNGKLKWQQDEKEISYRKLNTIDEKLKLEDGINNIKVFVKTKNIGFSKSINVNYNQTKGKYYALIIGVDLYDDPTIIDLDQPINDAKNLNNILTQKYTFDTTNVKLLRNPKNEEIIESLDYYYKNLTPDDNLLIFYAGHGYWENQFKQGYWLVSDSKKNNRATWISNSTIRDYIRAIPAKHSLLITDACFGGGIFKSRNAFQDASKAINQLYRYPSRKAMTSGALTEVPDRSVFIDFLIKRLSENKEKFLSSEQLFNSLKIAVINNSPNGQVPQFGEIRETGDEGGDFILIKKY